jgi:ubiquinone/menaquinone biosynthesis C-methylase UbiE
MKEQQHPNPQAIMQLGTGAWANGILAAAVNLDLFTHIHEGANNADALVEATRVSQRGIQPLLDGCVGLDLLQVSDGTYRNTPEVAAFLVRGRKTYLGDWIALHAEDMPSWSKLHEIVSSGQPLPSDGPADQEFYARLTPALIPLGIPVAKEAAEILGIASSGPIHVIDVGGGAGVFSSVWLQSNPDARATQIDSEPVNRMARGFVDSCGVGDRFEVINGDAAGVDWGEAIYDFGVFSHVAHALGPRENMEALRKFHRALRAGGRLLVVELVINDQRTGPPLALLFNCNMLLHTANGAAYTEADYRAWLAEAGFKDVRFEPTPGGVTLIIAEKAASTT